MKVWLCDLTYTQQSIASDTIPAAIGMIAEYLEKKIPTIPKTKLFKFPEDLSKELEKGQPDVIGFSSYMWSTSLSDVFMKRIKEVFPKIITVSGGPNFPSLIKTKLGRFDITSTLLLFINSKINL